MKRTVMRALALAAGLFALAVVLLHVYFAAMIAWWGTHAPRETAFMAERMDALRAKNPRAVLHYQFVPYERIAMPLKRAMIAAEDAKFVEHEGFDWDGIALLRPARRPPFSRAGRAARGDGAEPALLRAQPGRAGIESQGPHHPRAHAGGGLAVNGFFTELLAQVSRTAAQQSPLPALHCKPPTRVPEDPAFSWMLVQCLAPRRACGQRRKANQHWASYSR
jgi:hypothetical protein